MKVLNDLLDYLRAVNNGLPVSTHTERPEVDLAAARKHCLIAFESLEQRLLLTDEPTGPYAMSLWDWQGRWLNGPQFLRFVALAESELRGGLCAGETIAEVQAHLNLVIDAALGVGTELSSKVRQREIDRIAANGMALTHPNARGLDIAEYAIENRLVRRGSGTATVSPIGRVLLGLPWIDIPILMVTVETMQSTGVDDYYHMDISTIGLFLETQHCQFDSSITINRRTVSSRGLDEGEQWPFASPTFDRLVDFGIIEKWLSFGEGRSSWGYRLDPKYRPQLEDIVSQRRTPLSLLVETLLADERSSVSGHAVAVPTQESSAVLQARHARMVTHEIRNAIVPMRMALTSLDRAMAGRVEDEQWKPSRERLDRGFDRLFRFINELDQVARLGSSPSAPFDLTAAIRDAITGLNGGLGLELELLIDSSLPAIAGDRARFTMVIVNLLRNAAQNHPGPAPKARLRVTRLTSRSHVVVTVDDNGPGVPEGSREDIFRQGFALRSGGSGQGLALVREVIKVEMRGQVRCTQSDLGGASFVLEIPAVVGETP